MPFAEFAGDSSRGIYNPSGVLSDRLYSAVADLEGWRTTKFVAGANLFTQGATGPEDDMFYVITTGTVDIIRVGADGTEEIQARVGGRGAIVGVSRALDPIRPRDRTVRAAEYVVAKKLFHHDLGEWNGAKRPLGELHAAIVALARQQFESLSEADREMFGLDLHQWGVNQDLTNIPIQPIEEISPPPISIVTRLGKGALARRIERGPLPMLEPPPPLRLHRPRGSR